MSAPNPDAAALARRLFEAALGAGEVITVHLGVRLGLYEAIDRLGDVGYQKLAAETGTHPHYVREWLEQQAIAGLLTVDDPDAERDSRRFALSAAAREVLLDTESPFYSSPLALLTVGSATAVPGLLDVFRTGGGIRFADFGPDVRDGHAGFNKFKYTHQLTQQWLPALPDLHGRLASGAPLRVLDACCGVGWASVALGRAYPTVEVDGLDSDEESVAQARRNAADAGVADRVSFRVADAADIEPGRQYDLVCLFEAIHEMTRPVRTLAAVRRALAPGATVLVGEERVAETFTAPGDPVERLLSMGSVVHCLPVGMAEDGAAGTGALIRPATVRAYAREAGFSDAEILSIANQIFRFYRLVP